MFQSKQVLSSEYRQTDVVDGDRVCCDVGAFNVTFNITRYKLSVINKRNQAKKPRVPERYNVSIGGHSLIFRMFHLLN